jgi:hypothetical protein
MTGPGAAAAQAQAQADLRAFLKNEVPQYRGDLKELFGK